MLACVYETDKIYFYMNISGEMPLEGDTELMNTPFKDIWVTFTYRTDDSSYCFRLRNCKTRFHDVDVFGDKYYTLPASADTAELLLKIIEANNYLIKIYALDATMKKLIYEIVLILKRILSF